MQFAANNQPSTLLQVIMIPMTAIATVKPVLYLTLLFVDAALAVVDGEGAPLGEDALAFAWKASKLFALDSTALAAKTMP